MTCSTLGGMPRVTFGVLALGLSVALLQPASVWCQPRPAVEEPAAAKLSTADSLGGVRVRSLAECLQLAVAHYPEVDEAWARLQQARAQLRQATRSVGELRAQAGVGLAPELRGTALFSPDRDFTVTRAVSPGFRFEVQGVVPIWTFGQISGLRRAARAQVELRGFEVHQQQNKVRRSVHQAYFGAQFAKASLSLAKEVSQRLRARLPGLRTAVDAGESDPKALYEVELEALELEAREAEAKAKRAAARLALAFLTGSPHPVDTEGGLAAVSGPSTDVAAYLSALRRMRPELAMARAGVEAKLGQLEAVRGAQLPALGLGFSGRWSRAPSVSDQVNPFNYDIGNYSRLGIGLALQGNLDFLAQAARVDEARGAVREIEARQRYAQAGTLAEMRKAYAAAAAAQKQLAARSAKAKLARRWLTESQQGAELGLAEPGDLLAPAKAYALARFAELRSTYDFNLAMVELAMSTGTIAEGPVR